jgi:predicted regulator of Ras-like GTPase activity (Roadblock/LC7/MglB family)
VISSRAISVFGAQDIARLQSLLEEFADNARVRCVALVNRNGQLLTVVGDQMLTDTAAFASLTAADFAASDRLAELLGEEEFASLYHQGELGSMYCVAIESYAIMAALFDARSTLGLVRVHARSVQPRLTRTFEEIATRQSGPTTEATAMGVEWSREAEHEIDRLFGF